MHTLGVVETLAKHYDNDTAAARKALTVSEKLFPKAFELYEANTQVLKAQSDDRQTTTNETPAAMLKKYQEQGVLSAEGKYNFSSVLTTLIIDISISVNSTLIIC